MRVAILMQFREFARQDCLLDGNICASVNLTTQAWNPGHLRQLSKEDFTQARTILTQNNPSLHQNSAKKSYRYAIYRSFISRDYH